MLRSLPVTDPATPVAHRRRRQMLRGGRPSGRWGMFSFPLFQRLKAEAPEFEEVAAFQAGAAG